MSFLINYFFYTKFFLILIEFKNCIICNTLIIDQQQHFYIKKLLSFTCKIIIDISAVNKRDRYSLVLFLLELLLLKVS